MMMMTTMKRMDGDDKNDNEDDGEDEVDGDDYSNCQEQFTPKQQIRYITRHL